MNAARKTEFVAATHVNPTELTPPPIDAPPGRAPHRNHWLAFAIVLLAPVLATCVAGALDYKT